MTVKKIHDIGMNYDEKYECEPMDKKKKIYPEIRLTEEMCPFLEGAEVGEKLSLLAICKITEIKEEEGENEREYELEIQKLGEEGEMKMTKAVEKAIGPHKELE